MKLKNLNITTSKLLTSLVGGLALFLVPQDAKNIVDGMFRELYVAGIATLVVVLLFLIFKSYETIGISLIIVMVMTAINYTFNNISQNLNSKFSIYLDDYDGICFFLVWLIPFLICLVIRLFSFGTYNSDFFKKEFRSFMNLSTIAFIIYYIILLLAYFLFPRPVDFFSKREINLIFLPSNNNFISIMNIQINEYIKSFLFFIPLGFYVYIYKRDLPLWRKLILSLSAGIFIESFQFVFNTTTLSLWDIIFYILGFFVGGAIKNLLDVTRNLVTKGEEKTIFNF